MTLMSIKLLLIKSKFQVRQHFKLKVLTTESVFSIMQVPEIDQGYTKLLRVV
jgi:hypothetical protein